MKIFKYKLDKHTAEALGSTLDAALYWQLIFMEDCEYECEYIRHIEIMRYINKIRNNIFKILEEKTNELIVKDEEEIICLKEVLSFIKDWENENIDTPINLGETMDGILYQADDTQRKNVKELYKTLLEHITNNYVFEEIFEFDEETTFKEYYNLI